MLYNFSSTDEVLSFFVSDKNFTEFFNYLDNNYISKLSDIEFTEILFDNLSYKERYHTTVLVFALSKITEYLHLRLTKVFTVLDIPEYLKSSIEYRSMLKDYTRFMQRFNNEQIAEIILNIIKLIEDENIFVSNKEMIFLSWLIKSAEYTGSISQNSNKNRGSQWT